jgi:PLP dependent protein
MAGKSVAENLKSVRERISLASVQANRDASQVHLVAVSKTKPIELIDEAFAAGQKIFAENYVQELIPKAEARPNFEWHFIGRLQSNKIKQIVGVVSLIHSIDRSKLAAEVSGVAQRQGLTQDILLQVHVGDEATKGGAKIDDLEDFLKEVLLMPGIRVRGVMSLPPLTQQEEVARGYFSQVNSAFLKLKNKITEPSIRETFDILSIGTSSDFEWAIYEGATHVRVGTAIFGERL